MNMSEKIKIGVFGGRRGLSLLAAAQAHPECVVTAVCDMWEPFLEDCRKFAEAKNMKISLHKDFESFFQEDMDAVILANYANEHAPYAIRCLNSGRHVLSELLPVQTIAEAVALVEAVEKSGKVYGFAENCCYMRHAMEMKKYYRQGMLGEFLHGEGEYVHNCMPIWERLTRNDPNHWRNRMYSTFYCTHSLGPILTITGTRPVRVVGFENFNPGYLKEGNCMMAVSGMLAIQMDNGATVKNLNGFLKREPAIHWYTLYGTKGFMENARIGDENRIYIQFDDDESTKEIKTYIPEQTIQNETGHGGADYYAVHYFLQRILGTEDGKEMIDVYTALDMFLPGLLGYRSILNGNIPYEIPDFRDKEKSAALREKYRNDHACTDPKVAKDQLLPVNSRMG
jgi:predicted dehydrogenase